MSESDGIRAGEKESELGRSESGLARRRARAWRGGEWMGLLNGGERVGEEGGGVGEKRKDSG